MTRQNTGNAPRKFRWRLSGSSVHWRSRAPGGCSTAKYSLVDAAYAPFLQRYFFLDRIQPIGLIGQYPRLSAWADTLMKRPTTHSFPEPEFEVLYRLNVKRRKKWLSQFVAEEAVAAAA